MKRRFFSGINIDIPKRKIFGLLGPSGAGKTTLIKILTGQLDYDRGNVRTLGKDVKSLTLSGFEA